MKYVLVSGGVISGIGKGIIASSTGLLLKTQGLKVSSIKIDPYMNVDAGTMNPKEHGEVFVLDDGGEVDLDLGNYERYLNVKLTRKNNITTGKIYEHVIQKERRGDYLGKTVQVVPHLTDATQEWIEQVARIPVDDSGEEPDACIIELGGTVGDIESAPFVESMRQLRRRAGKGNFAHIHVSLVPNINGEQKTKPTQQAIRDVRSLGLSPDLVACRCDVKLEPHTIEKIAMYCQVESEQVLAVHNVDSTYHVPMLLEQQALIPLLNDLLNLKELNITKANLKQGQLTWAEWKSLTAGTSPKLLDPVNIALVGKYVDFHDSYLSVIKALEHAAMACNRKLNIIWIDSEHLELKTKQNQETTLAHYKAWHELCSAQGILVPGGFGPRGTEGMIAVAQWARTNKRPYLGICLGMQLAVVEYARNVCGLPNAGSEELAGEAANPKVIINMPEIDHKNLGGTMRLGIRPTYFQDGSEWSRIRALYSKDTSQQPLLNGHSHASASHSHVASSASADPDAHAILERHRHRYEVNPSLVEQLSDAGLNFIGKDDKGERMEIVELKDHPYFVGVQFHPEYLSRVLEPSKPYLGLVAASIGQLDKAIKNELRTRAPSVNGIAGQIEESLKI